MVLTGLSGGRPILVRSPLPTTAFHRNYRTALFSDQGSRDATADRFGGPPQRIVIEVRIPRGGRCLSVTQQPADDRQPHATAGTEARVGVPQIVQANAGQTGALGDGIPRALQIVARLLRIVAGHHVRADPLQLVQHRKGRGVEDDGLPAALAVGQEQTAALKIDVLPPQVQDFPQAAAGEEQAAEAPPPRTGRSW